MTSIKYSGLLLITAAIWGFSFVAQRAGMEYVGPFTFNGIRFALGSLSLLPLFFINQKRKSKLAFKTSSSFIFGGGVLGIVLFLAASLQQIGMQFTTAANGGFITSLYVILVPVFAVFIGHKIKLNIWLGAILATIGLYFLSVHGNLQLNWGDILVLMSAVFWAIHVILIGYFAPRYSIIFLSILQFAATSILSLITAIIFEEIHWQNILDAAIPIIYGGVFSVGIAYTLQVFAQKKVASAPAAIILSFESAFAMLGGWMLLNEYQSLQTILGALLMLIGIVLAQINWNKKTIR